MRGSHLEVAAGLVRIHVYNRGMDDHDLTLVDARGRVHTIPLAPGADARLDAELAPGAVRLYCSLFAGTPDSHVDQGMVFDLRVREAA
jgi:hypothetical protein